MVSFSNTKLVGTPVASTVFTGYHTDTYETTPPLPTYLIAFIVSKYERRINTEAFGILTRPQSVNATALALDFGKKMVDKFSDYLGINYFSLNSKMDMASIPDFSAGGKKFRNIFLNDMQLTLSYYLYSYGGETAASSHGNRS